MNAPLKYSFSSFPPITTALLFIQLVLLLLGNKVLSIGIACNGCIAEGEWWRLISSLFVHTTFSHFLSNSVCCFALGFSLEKQLHSIRFPLVFLTSGITGNIASYLLFPPQYTHTGASGAIFGLLGVQLYLFYMQYQPTRRKEILLFVIILCILLAFTFLNTTTNSISHLAGLLTGACLGPLFIKKTDGA
ncbi:rhomboid family intramembrane serine protease [Bacillus cereus group sp. BfR-BA-01380]|uniref:rhomboid family protein n=1 Tax=Bacillus cereus group sp. BfR-BA-01380 TaxID=2920324 RepID=UPI001F5828B3|nr:rhomboid family intramembrane serine protease [Bacillus cereus group sp. BfR-BA-01380]